MDNNIITAISAVGFPIVACLLMGYVYFRTLSEIRLIIEELKGIISATQTLSMIFEIS